MARGRKPGKLLGPLRTVIDYEGHWLQLSTGEWRRVGVDHVMSCGHRLLVDQVRAQGVGYSDRRCCFKCLPGSWRWMRLPPLDQLTDIRPLREAP